MRKRSMLIALLAVLVLLLAACECEHEWKDATCEDPKTCKLCGETKGDVGDHDWKDATCTDPKTCSVCKESEGEPLGHTWEDATCVAPKTCSVCKATEGETVDHTWEEATTEAPKTCSVCAATEGEKLQTDSRFTTASTKELQGTWVSEMSITNEDLAAAGSLDAKATLTFSSTGEMFLTYEITNKDEFLENVKNMMVEQAYASMLEKGYTKAQTEQAFQSLYGMSVTEFAEATMEEQGLYDSFDGLDMQQKSVYYVQNGKLYTATDWDDTFRGQRYTLEDGKLEITGVNDPINGGVLVWEREQ